MKNKIEALHLAVETLKISELREHIKEAISCSRYESINSMSKLHAAFSHVGTDENRFFDRMVYFNELTKELSASITDCEEKIKSNHEKWLKICNEIDDKHVHLCSYLSELEMNISQMLEKITDGRLLNNKEKSQEPLGIFHSTVMKENYFDLQEAIATVNAVNYKPKGINRYQMRFFVKPGEYENFIIHKREAIKILEILNSNKYTKELKEYKK